MKTKCWLVCWQLKFVGFLTTIWLSSFTDKALAQSTPSNIHADETLGTESSQVRQNFQGQPFEVITGGAIRGINLFHSFREFNVSEGREAYFFSLSAGIQNILARVTGGNRSEILGTLGTSGNSQPNLFLINPNGIIFGENASLDLQGSFVATTANGLQFGNQGLFSATNPQAPALLTINPSAFLFNQINRNTAIQNNASTTGLNVAEGRSLLLVGGNVSMDGGTLFAPGGRVELGGLAETGSVGIQQDGNIFSLNFPLQVQRADILLNNSAEVDVTSGGGGNVTFNGRSINVLGGSQILAGIDEDLGTFESQAGDIILNATREITLEQESLIRNAVFNTGNGGNVIFNTQDLFIKEGSQVLTGILGVGKGGNITVNTSRNFEMIGTPIKSNFPSRLLASVGAGSMGKGGDVTVNTQNLFLRDGALVGTSTFGEGNAGNLTVNATDIIQLIGISSDGFSLSSLNASAQVGSKGNAGNLIVNTTHLLLRDGARVRSSTFGRGKGGNLTVNASNKVEAIGVSANTLFPSGIFASSQPGETGDAGNLTIYTQNMMVRDGAQVNASTFGKGNGGNLTVNASNSVELIGTYFNDLITAASGLYAQADPSSSGDGGTLIVNTQNLFVRDGARVSTGTLGTGNGGNLTINAPNVQLIGTDVDGISSSGLFSFVQRNSTKSAGNVIVNVKDLIVRDGAQVDVGTFGKGQGGNLSVNATNSVQLIGASPLGVWSGLFARQETKGATGNAGNLTIDTKDLIVQDGAKVSAATIGAGKGGNLTINATNSVQVLDKLADDGLFSGIFTQAFPNSSGDAGDLKINTQYLLVQDRGQVNASTFGSGKGGNVTVNASQKVEIIGNVESTRNTNNTFSFGLPFIGSGIFASADRGSTGNGGDLTINTQNLLIWDGGQVATGTSSSGRSGNLTVNANSVRVVGDSANGLSASKLITSTARNAKGNAGNLTINTQDLFVENGGEVGALTFGAGNGGNVTVNATKSVQLFGTSATNGFPSVLSSSTLSTGDAGTLNLNTQNLLIRDGGEVSTSTFGSGKAGNLTINAENLVELIGKSSNDFFYSNLSASANLYSTGDAGDLKVNTRNLLVRDRAGIFVNSRGTGNAGIMTINADTIRLDNQASLNANTRSPNKDPNREQATINLNTQNLTLRRNSSITTNASGENVIGGNININTKFLIAPENSRISANSDNSRGGRVRINARGVFVGTKLSDVSNYITATSGVGLSGSVDVNSPDNSSLQNSLTELSQNPIDTNALLADSCIVRSQEKQQSSFTITGTGGLPNHPGENSISNYSTGDIRNVTNENASPLWKKGDPIIEPQGVYRLSDGKLVMSRECR